MPNTIAETILALNPDHYWRLDEAATPFTDDGDTGGFDLATTNAWHQAPGIGNGLPTAYGMWTGQDPGGPGDVVASFAGGVSQLTATITFACFIVNWADTDQDWQCFANEYLNNSGIWWGMVVFGDGTLRFESRGNSQSSRIYGQTAAGAIQRGVQYHVAGVQRGDGTGVRVYINGVDVTDSQLNSGVTVNAWTNETHNASWTPSDIGFQATGYSDGGDRRAGIVSHPAVWVDTTLTTSQIANIHAAANLDLIFQDFHEAVMQLVGENLVYYMTTADFGNDVFVGASQGNAGSTINTAIDGSNVPDNDIVSPYNWLGFPYDTTTSVIRESNVSRLVNLGPPSIGTVHHVVKVTEAAIDDVYTYWSFGSGAVWVQFSIVGSGLGMSARVRFQQDSSGDFWQGVFFLGLLAINEPVINFTWVQDGNGLELYVDGSREDMVVSSSGTLFDETSWFSTVDGPANTPSVNWGGEPGSASNDHWSPNELRVGFISTNALTSTQVFNLYNAYLGIFPVPPTPPPSGFFETITEIGNEADPNGPGPNHYWRMNSESAEIIDVGISTVSGNSRALGGDPLFQVNGPFITDPTNFAIFFDGAGDYFEIGVDAAAGELVDSGVGSVGFFVSVQDLSAENLAYSQASDDGSARVSFGINAGKPEIFVQTSAGNSARYTATNAFENRDFVFIVFTNDGSEYRIYIDAVLDETAVLDLEGTGAQGDWFDTITATRSAIAALANSGFLTSTAARFSEVFIYEEVLSAAQIGAAFEAAVADGINVNTNALAVLTFEDVKFLNGGAADIRAENPRTDFQQALIVDACQFLDGAQAAEAEAIRLVGVVNAQVRGSTFDVGEAPVLGRGGVHGTVADPTADATTFGSLIVTDSTFNRMGNADDPAIFLEAGFTATVSKSRFKNGIGGAVGWRGDARRLIVKANEIADYTTALGAIHVREGLNTQIGTSWIIDSNVIDNVALGAGISLNGGNSSLAEFARDIIIRRNSFADIADDGLNLRRLSDALITSNEFLDTEVDGVRLREMNGLIAALGNKFTEFGLAIRIDPDTVQTVALIVAHNAMSGALNGDGVSLDNVSRAFIQSNQFLNLVNGFSLGTITGNIYFHRNTIFGTTAPFANIGSSTQVDRLRAENNIQNLPVAATTILVETEAATVIGRFNLITSTTVQDLVTLNGGLIVGQKVILQLDVGSSDITMVETGNLNLAGDFLMDSAGISQIELVFDGTDWSEVSRNG